MPFIGLDAWVAQICQDLVSSVLVHGSVLQTCTLKLPDFRLECLLMLIFFQGYTNAHKNTHDVIEKTV